MKILFLHRNFPAQFRHLALLLSKDPDNQVVFLTNRKEHSLPGIHKFVYELHREVKPDAHHYLKFYEDSILHGQGAVRAALELKRKGFIPDVIIGHSWGPSMFMKDVFPESKYIAYLEWFYNIEGSDIDFDKSKPIQFDLRPKTRVKNSHILVDLYSCDMGITPTEWQKTQFPSIFHDKIQVIHDGIDTDFFKPDKEAKLVLPNLDLSHAKEIVTYATRGMEAYRGFPQFMEAAEIILKRRPDCHIVIAGEDRVCYGSRLPNGKTYKEHMLEKLDLDMSRVHFTDRLPYDKYLKLLQCSNAHVYLTYPFVLSWSLLEAMSTGCLIIASDTQPVKEVMQDGVNGILTDFFSVEKIADKVDEVLNNPDKYTELRENARDKIVENYDLKQALKKQVELINDLISEKICANS